MIRILREKSQVAVMSGLRMKKSQVAMMSGLRMKKIRLR